MSEKNKQYWFCVIGPAEKKDIPFGGDYPIRQATKKEYFRMFPDQEDYEFSSGWGVTKDMKNAISKLMNLKQLKPEKYKALQEQIMNTSSE